MDIFVSPFRGDAKFSVFFTVAGYGGLLLDWVAMKWYDWTFICYLFQFPGWSCSSGCTSLFLAITFCTLLDFMGQWVFLDQIQLMFKVTNPIKVLFVCCILSYDFHMILSLFVIRMKFFFVTVIFSPVLFCSVFPKGFVLWWQKQCDATKTLLDCIL